MNLFFERIIDRRDFLKKCSVIAFSSSLVPGLIKFSDAQKAEKGLIQHKEAKYYKKLTEHNIQCLLCPRTCIVANGKRGFCRVRENNHGKYYTLAHSNPCAVHIDPIEKKPLYHFHPGTPALSIATAGCNFTCKNCQNWDISQSKPDDTINFLISPGDLVDLALYYDTPTIAYTYTEPTVFFEYMLDTAIIAHKKGVLNIYHSNGYISEEPLKELIPFLDGANVDLKAYSNEFYNEIAGGTLEPVLNTLKTLKHNGVWLEITNLVIPTKNDTDKLFKELCNWVKNELGADTPIHFARFYPQYKLQNIPPTPLETLQKAARIARSIGLRYIYIGNVRGVDEENTICPGCHRTIIERKGYKIIAINIENGQCEFCGAKISGVW